MKNILRKLMYIVFGFITALIGFYSFLWFSGDSINRKFLETEVILLSEPILSDKRIILWLEKYHGEAPSYQVMISFIKWGNSNPLKFRKILSRLNVNTLDRLSFAIYDSGQYKNFMITHDKFKFEPIFLKISNQVINKE